jgi:hypothetical protein
MCEIGGLSDDGLTAMQAVVRSGRAGLRGQGNLLNAQAPAQDVQN